jgi:hypothetical protein
MMRGIQLGFLVAALLSVTACGETSSGEGTGGTGGTGDQHPVDQCVNDADQAIYDDLGAGAVGDVAAGCANPAAGCGGPLGAILGGDTSENARKALGDCIAQCVSDETGLSTECTSCYGLITTCAIADCLEPCLPPNSGSAECAACSTENCGFFDACLGI